MTKPRAIVGGTTYLITRRCVQREFWLRPGRVTNEIFQYSLAAAAKRYRLAVHAVCVMSNHYHLVVTDREGRLPEFEAWLNRALARALNVVHGRREALWRAGSYNAVELLDAETVFEKMVYVLVNPVAAGLVAEGDRWPGVRAAPFAPRTIVGGARPRVYFSTEAAASSRLALAKPPGFEDVEDAEFGKLLRERVEEKERELREQAAVAGWRFRGREAVLRQTPGSRPKTVAEESIAPRVAGRSRVTRERALKRYAAFVEAYEEARRSFRAGKREVEFPYGTYWMRVHCGVRCQGPPAEAA